jgi:hypothetical protein
MRIKMNSNPQAETLIGITESIIIVKETNK